MHAEGQIRHTLILLLGIWPLQLMTMARCAANRRYVCLSERLWQLYDI